MAFTSLATRIIANNMPVLICGPILRRVETTAVTIWVALKKEQKVWLEVYEDISTSGAPPNLKKILTGERITIKLGANLHVTAVTAAPVTAQTPMTSGKIYYYNVFFTDPFAGTLSITDPNLQTPGMTPFELHYAHEPEDLDPQHLHVHLPSFCIAPDDLNQVRIVHGSCRKAHAEGTDAMPGIDDMILADRFDPIKRPHYLLLTGDQFYADDISPVILYLLMDAELALFDAVESLPQEGTPQLPNANGENFKFFRGQRKDKGGFSSGESNHLATAGEYMSYYLFMWSDVVWQGTDNDDFPSSTVIGGSTRAHNNDLVRLKRFYNGLARVRRAMANVPVYMIFDDHDVTDDWYMTYDWCERTLTNDLGRRMIMNGLLSYAIFQAWGNTPELFFERDANGNKTKGKLLLEAAEAWFMKNTRRDDPTSLIDREPVLQQYLGIPANSVPPLIQLAYKDPDTGLDTDLHYYMINQGSDALRWDYQISRTNYEIKFLDGRTKRGYPDPAIEKKEKRAHPDIISELSIKQQFDHDDPSLPLKEVTLVVAPTSMVSIPAIELDEFPWFVSMLANWEFDKNVYEYDVFDHWKNQSRTVENFMKLLSERNAPQANPGQKSLSRVVVLTGDVHFSAASRLEYESENHKTLFAQFISSSFLKQDIKTRILHQRGYKFSNISALALGQAFITKIPKKFADIPYVGPILIFPVFIIGIVLHLLFVMLDQLIQILDQTILKDLLEKKGMDPRHFLGWKNPNSEGITRLLIPTDGKDEEIKLKIPAVIENEVLKEAREPKLKFPDWQYRVDFIIAENNVRAGEPLPGEELTAPSPGDRSESLKRYLAMAKYHLQYAKKWGNGKEIVGVNNISEIFFDWGNTEKIVRQETWWRLEGNEGELKLFPLSNFKVPLNFNDKNFPLPAMPQAPNP